MLVQLNSLEIIYDIEYLSKMNYIYFGDNMIRNINKDIKILMLKATQSTIADIEIGEDLKDTLIFNRDKCVGMAANMIGVSKAIIAFIDEEEKVNLMYNPKIIKYIDEYYVEEGCLSLDGTRKTKRYKKIKVEYYNQDFQKRIKNFSGFTAEIIQHEIDHLNGIII